MKKNVFYSIALVALLFSSCATPNVSYFNDMNHGQIEDAVKELDILLLPDDKISIVVKSKDALLSDLFNLPIVSHRVGYTQASSEEVVNRNLGKSRKRDIRTSFRDGAEIVESPTLEEVRDFYAILNDLYINKVKTPLYPFSFFECLYHQEYSRFLLVRLHGKIIGGTVCVCLSEYAVYEWFACGEDGVYKNIYPSTVATYAGIMYAAKKDYHHFDMMGAGKPDESYGVREFKAKFGGKLVEHGRFIHVLKPTLFYIGKIGVKFLKKFG